MEPNPQLSDCHSGQFFLNIADISVSLASEDPKLKLRVEGSAKRFLVPSANPDVRIQAGWRDICDRRSGKKLFDSGILWQLYAEDGSYHFHFTTPTLGSVPYKMASFNRDFTSGQVYFHYPYFPLASPLYPLDYPLDELLLVNLLARGKGVEVHACGVADSQGNGHLFLGQSGAGKTTLAKLWQSHPGVTVLSDDRIILRRRESSLWMYGTPWHGEADLASPIRVPLTKVYFLTKGTKNELVPLRGYDAAGRFFACSFPPFYSRQGLDFTLCFLEEIVRAVPCHEFKFLPDETVLGFILKKDLLS